MKQTYFFKGYRRPLRASRIFFVFDFDGTLVPLRADPDDVSFSAPRRKRFDQFCLRYPTAVLTGRSRKDVMKWVRGFQLKEVVGNHGSEWGPKKPRAYRHFLRLTRRWKRALRPFLADQHQVWLEDKGASLTLHVRPCTDKVVRVWKERAKLLPQCRVVLGKRVINLLPQGAPHKGDAIEKIARRNRPDILYFLGDDVTDEFGLRLRRAAKTRIETIRVGKSLHSRAKYYLRAQSEIDRFLKFWVERSINTNEPVKAVGG